MCVLILMAQILCFVGFANADYGEYTPASYEMYLGVALMMVVGFGYLMTFLKQYGLGAVGFTFIITSLAVQINIFLAAYIPDNNRPVIDAVSLMDGNFAAATVLISYGCIIGKASPSQLVIMTIIESLVFQVNRNMICVKEFNVEDAGGTILIHLFGAYFGLSVAAVLGKPNDPNGAETSSATSDVLSLIGTVFLWLYWPSFNSGGFSVVGMEADAGRAVANTVIGLLASCTSTFITSGMISGRLQPVDIQNATLAGGVAVGAIARMDVGAGWASVIGGLGGGLSTVGYNYVQPFLLSKTGLHDSCGVHNLHGMPALFGGLVSIIFVETRRDDGLVNPEGKAGGYQAAAVFVSLTISITSGLLTGVVLKSVKAAMKKLEAHQENTVSLSSSTASTTFQQRAKSRQSVHFTDDRYWNTSEQGP